MTTSEEQRPQRRPKVKAGEHMSVWLDNGNPGTRCQTDNDGDTIHRFPVWFTRTGPRCDNCWHLLTDHTKARAETMLRDVIRALAGGCVQLVADDYDDSTEGMSILTASLQRRLPYLRLSPEPRQRRLFRIVTLIHQLHHIDDDPELTYEDSTADMASINSKLNTEITELMKVAIK